MEASETAKLFIDALEKIAFFWNFYTVTLLALIGWFVSKKESSFGPMRWLVAAGYLIFASMNVFGLWSTYDIAEALQLDLIDQLNESGHLVHTGDALRNLLSFESRRWLSVGIHVVIGLPMLYFILFHDRRKERE